MLEFSDSVEKVLKGEAYFENRSVPLFYNTSSKNKVLRYLTAIMSPSYSEKIPKVLSPKYNIVKKKKKTSQVKIEEDKREHHFSFNEERYIFTCCLKFDILRVSRSKPETKKCLAL